ncbi:hypothetical protein B0J13DRAFT_550219 [Dactylonectria estremocensis]|uniref:Uncharacterized protein n=1 Tax=Dactylonectria estremocensis TaxID=1079267 RepID=A0A9P9F1Q1_9HYPO|nr:hypothetical protein B0J13DRAFT_550219 [Dactylonectria estremocensis]
MRKLQSLRPLIRTIPPKTPFHRITSNIMSRTVSIIVYTSRLFPAHWALWIPSQADAGIGKRVHATGDARVGFEVVFDRNYDIEHTGRQHQLVPLANVLEAFIDEASCTVGPLSSECRPCDKIEEVALRVPAPGPSLVASSSNTPRHRVPIKNCQTWLAELVGKLIEEGVMDDEARTTISQVPKN